LTTCEMGEEVARRVAETRGVATGTGARPQRV
jgi:hypothetical protein